MSGDAFYDESKLKAALLYPEPESGEQTLVGGLIGFVRDGVSVAPADEAEASARAASNDMFAELAVDTVAMMPGVHWAKAGVVRAVGLLNPNAGSLENASYGAVNFAEGVALHGVGKMGARFLHAPSGVSHTLTSETVGLFKFGACAGGVKAAFDEHTWLDKDKQFRGADGLLTVVKSGIVGGALGVPSGMVGSRVARFGMHHLADSGLSPRALSVGLGMTSGYSAGAVFGGVDSALKGGTVAQILMSAKDGGWTGMAAGGLSGLAMPHELAIAKQKGRMLGRHAESVDFEAEAGAVMERTTGIRKSSGDVIPREHFTKIEMKAANQDLEVNLSLLGEPVPGKIERYTAVPDAQKIADSIVKSCGDDLQTGKDAYFELAVVATEEPALVYKLHGVDVVVPEPYARDLDRVFQLRIAKQKGARPGATHDESVAGQKAALALESEPFKDRAHPADLVATVELADIEILGCIEVHPGRNAGDFWTRATYKPDFVSAGTASRDGTLRLYQPRLDSHLAHVLHHEWAHFLNYQAVREAELFGYATRLEEKSHANRKEEGFVTSNYSKRNLGERWAEDNTNLTEADPTSFYEMAQDAPLRLIVLARANERALNSVSPARQSEHHGTLRERLGLVDTYVLPRARQLMEHYLKTGSEQEKIAAAHLLRDFGGGNAQQNLMRAAMRDANAEVRKAAFYLASDMSKYALGRPVAYSPTKIAQPQSAYENFLISMASTESRSRDRAMNHLDCLPGARAEGYHALLRSPGAERAQRHNLFEAMIKIPDLTGKQEAFRQAKLLYKDNAQGKFDLATEVMERVPRLRGEALELMLRTDRAQTEPILKNIAMDPLDPLHERASAGLATIETARRVEQLTQQSSNASPAVRIQAIQELGKIKDYSAIRPLLWRVRAGGPVESRIARQALTDNYHPQIVKAEMANLVKEDSSWRSSLEPLMNSLR